MRLRTRLLSGLRSSGCSAQAHDVVVLGEGDALDRRRVCVLRRGCPRRRAPRCARRPARRRSGRGSADSPSRRVRRVETIGVLPSSTMLATSGTPLNRSAIARNSASLCGASTKRRSAPAFRYASARRSASSRPEIAARVGAGDDEEIVRRTRAGGGADFRRALLERDDLFALHVAAAFGQHLIFELDRRGAGLLVGAHQALDVGDAAMAVVAVGDQAARARRQRSARARARSFRWR